jgi:hypothetical protein
MVDYWQIILVFFLISPVQAQDERYFRQILSGELPQNIQEAPSPLVSQFNVNGPSYRFDLNEDNNEEIIETQKRDGVDWIEIRTSSQNKIFQTQLPVMGAESYIYKMKIVHLSTKLKAIIVFVDEGKVTGKKFESTGRIFILSFENNDLSGLTLTQGPHFFHEKQSQRDIYWRRDYNVNIYDIDGDGVREVSIEYNHIQRIMKYKGRGEWQRF